MKAVIETIKSTPCMIINLNVSNFTLNKALFNHIKEAISLSNDVKVIIIRGSKDVFCKGMDLKEIAKNKITKQEIVEKLIEFKDLMTLLTSCPIPIIAQVDGNVYGGGLGIVCAADIVIMANNIEISLPETIMGIIPAMIYPYITKRLSVSKAKALTLGSRPLSSTEAFSLGLADELSEDTESALIKCIKRISNIDSTACKDFKYLFQKYYGVNDSDYYNEAMQILSNLIASDSTKERLSNFIGGDFT